MAWCARRRRAPWARHWAGAAIALAAGLDVGGAVVMEKVSGLAVDHVSGWWVVWVAGWTIEEILELTGVALMVYATLRYLRGGLGVDELDVRIAAPSC